MFNNAQQEALNMANLLRAKQVAKKRGRSISRLYADIAEGRFPKGVKLGNKIVVWKESEVDAHIESELKQARQARQAGGEL
jgi:predicted DNA-binding transcriptional regulator AlpA